MPETASPSSPKVLWFNAFFLFTTPILAAVLLPLHIAANGVHWSEPVAMFTLWILTGLGITAGYHRMFSHRTWWAPRWVRRMLLICGAAAWQNDVITWSSSHRYHHRDVDTDDDPYNIRRGFLYAHMLWIMLENPRAHDHSNARDLLKDDLCVWQQRNYMLIGLAFNIGLPLLLGLLTGNVIGMLLWAGLLRVVLVHHATFFINSLAHMWGGRHWNDSHTARDNALLALFTFGEGYHNFHHTFPGDYRNGVRWYQFDPTKWLIWTLDRLGLAHDLKRSSIDRRLRKRWDFLSEQNRARIESFTEEMRKQLDEAEARLEATMSEARALRREWSEKARELRGQARKDLKRACRDAERRMIEEFRLMQRMLREATTTQTAQQV